MRRNAYLILNLHDQPLHSRPSFASHHYLAPRSTYGGRVLGAGVIVLVAGGFLLAYGSFFHSNEIGIPAMTQSAVPASFASKASTLIPPDAPAPDMNAPAVRFAN